MRLRTSMEKADLNDVLGTTSQFRYSDGADQRVDVNHYIGLVKKLTATETQSVRQSSA
jgi:hypothetical protein